MAYSDGNSVDLEGDYFTLSSVGGIPSNGFPMTLAAAVHYQSGFGNGDVILSVSDSSANGIVQIRHGNWAPGMKFQMSTYDSGYTDYVHPTNFGTDLGLWVILVARFTDKDDWDFSINGDLKGTAAAAASNVMTGFDRIDIANDRGVVPLDFGDMAWAAVWWDADMSDANMNNLSDGTTPPNDLSPDYLFYFEGTTCEEGVGDNDPTATGTARSTFAEDPTGWPPAAASSIIPQLQNHYRQQH